MDADSKATGQSYGDRVRNVIQGILDRCDSTDRQMGFPGEGGERRFRGWLISDFLQVLLGWPSDKIVVGERFDVTLKDADGYPVITVETKSPHKEAPASERKDFRERLAGFGTLRYAYLTNGEKWDRLTIYAPTGTTEIHDELSLELTLAGADEIEAFFAPLSPDRYLNVQPRRSRQRVSGDSPHILRALAGDLDRVAMELRRILRTHFEDLRAGRGGKPASDVAKSVFELWCDKSLTVSPRQVAHALAEAAESNRLNIRQVTSLLKKQGLESDLSRVAEHLAGLSQPSQKDTEITLEIIWGAFESRVEKLCSQTAHVLLGRILLYRVGEDQAVFPAVLSGPELQRNLLRQQSALTATVFHATAAMERVQKSMRQLLPSIFELGEFDWWQVLEEKRALLGSREKAWLSDADRHIERGMQIALRIFDAYFFGSIDVDVWRNVYQSYMPADERQRLGGFYTPDELVELTLDRVGFRAESRGLCDCTFVDPACGSGAFVASALSRLLRHFSLKLPCHEEIAKRGVPPWKGAEFKLRAAMRNLHAVDLHPFAAFLTTINVLFQLIPLYAQVRSHNRSFVLDLSIFSADSLEKHDEDLIAPDLFASLNSRVQLSENSFRRYQEMLGRKFNFVFGNPPWGGVLKGPLAPVYDRDKKARFTAEYPATAQGKYDVYGLFIERAFQILEAGGTLGIITQGTFIDQDWAAGLRSLLSRKVRVEEIIDLNPFGPLFFSAMNTPCITIANNSTPRKAHYCRAVLSSKPDDFQGRTQVERRAVVVETVRQVVDRLRNDETCSIGFAYGARVPVEQLEESASKRWDLTAPRNHIVLSESCRFASDFLEATQGVTPGGFLHLYLIPGTRAKELRLDRELLRAAVKSKRMEKWRVEEQGSYLLYPYRIEGKKARPAFSVNIETISDRETADLVRRSDLKDALDFTKTLDEHERHILQNKGLTPESVKDLLNHRVALEIVPFVNTARYLVDHYQQLEGRVFEGKTFLEHNKMWYEYHRKRKPSVMLARERILSPTIVRNVHFALDENGILSDHACLFIQPSSKTILAYRSLKKQLSMAFGREVSRRSVLVYCLAFLNSPYAQRRLLLGRRPTPRGFYPVKKEFLDEVPIPAARGQITRQIVKVCEGIVAENDLQRREELASKLGKLTMLALGSRS